MFTPKNSDKSLPGRSGAAAIGYVFAPPLFTPVSSKWLPTLIRITLNAVEETKLLVRQLDDS